MNLIDDLLATLLDGDVERVCIGAFWTAVVATVEGARRAGLAATPREDDHHHTGQAAVRDAGRLAQYSSQELAALARSGSAMEVAIGFAAINALLPREKGAWTDLNAEEHIAEQGRDKRVALVGHFPFVPHLRPRVGTLWVLEQQPRGQDLPAEAAATVIPQADVLAITGTTIINGTFEGLMALRRPDTFVLVLGPTTPLSPVLFHRGVNVLSGAVVENVDAVLRAVNEGANFQQIHKQGVRLVALERRGRA